MSLLDQVLGSLGQQRPVAEPQANWKPGDGLPESFPEPQLPSHTKWKTKRLLRQLNEGKKRLDTKGIPPDERRKIYRERVKGLADIKSLFERGGDDTVELMLSELANLEISDKWITDGLLDRYKPETMNVLGKTAKVYPHNIFRKFIKDYDDTKGGNAFASDQEISFSDKLLEDDAKFANTMTHEVEHLQGERIYSGELMPYEHEARPEEQRADYNRIKKLIESGYIDPSYVGIMSAKRKSPASEWIPREGPLPKQVSNIPFNDKVVDPYDFYRKNTRKPTDTKEWVSSKTQGKDSGEFGYSGYYDKLLELSKLPEGEQIQSLMDLGVSEADAKNTKEYWLDTPTRIESAQSMWNNTLQKLYDEHNAPDVDANALGDLENLLKDNYLE
jgi:hypothetical protein